MNNMERRHLCLNADRLDQSSIRYPDVITPPPLPSWLCNPLFPLTPPVMPLSRYDEDVDSGDISLSLPLSQSSPQLSTILHAGPSKYRDAPTASPTPRRLLGKTLWPKPLDTDEEDELSLDGLPAVNGERRASSAKPQTVSNAQESPTKFTRRTSSSTTVTSLSRSRSMNVRMPSVDLSSGNGRNAKPTGNGQVGRTPSTRLGWSRRPGEPRPPPLVDEQVAYRMGRWIKEIVVCNFDLERGPVVERRLLGRRWGPGEKENV